MTEPLGPELFEAGFQGMKGVELSEAQMKASYELWSYQFCLWAEYSGIKVDGHDFSFHGHNYLTPLYMDRSLEIVLMKAAQMGATIWMLLKSFHMALFPEAWGFVVHGKKMPINVGFYFPNRDLVNLMVKGRVEPMMKSTPFLEPFSREKSRQWKPINDCALWFMYMGGTSTKDAVPLMSIMLDEVRLMDTKDVRQAHERVSHSPLKYKVHASTAGYPEGDIHKLFLESDQKWFHTICERCGTDQVMPLEFPNCVAEHTIGPRRGDVYFICKKPSCRGEITNAQRGMYLPHGDPNHPVSGYQFSQLISSRASAFEIWRFFKETDNIKEFWNAKLGMPFVDEENRPVTIELLESGQNVNPLIEWGQHSGGTYMGIDQMMNLNYHTIVEVRGESRRIVWIEITEDTDPFKRSAELMEEFDIGVCVCSTEPNTNDALKFANNFKKRVYLAKEGGYEDMQRWNDHWRPKKQLLKASKETYYQYRCFLDKYQSIGRTLEWIRDARITWGDPDKFIREQTPLKGGRLMPMPVLRTHYYPHMCCAVREKEEIGDPKKEEKKYKWKWRFIGHDPHGLDSLNFAITASTRKRHGGVLF